MKFYYFKKSFLSLFVLSVLLLILIIIGVRIAMNNIIGHPVSNVSIKNMDIKKANTNNNVQSSQTVANENKKKYKNEKKDFFVEYRLERDRNRDRQMELLKEIVNNTNSVEEARKEAQKRILNKTNIMDKELELENLIRARGYKDAIAMMQDKNLTILVQINNLTAEDMAKITEIAEQSTGIDRSKIVVLAKT